MVNLEIRKFEQDIIKLVNESQLPIEIKRLCMAEIMGQIDAAAEQKVYAEKAQEESKEQEKSKSYTESGVEDNGN